MTGGLKQWFWDTSTGKILWSKEATAMTSHVKS